MDAIIVSGTTLAFGAVAAVQNVAHPVSVARAVMEKTPHCLLAAKGATDFAHANGFAFVPTARLIGHAASGPDHGTVGAVALDIHGHIAAATSTGGTANKLPGRVGDSPLIGCGAIADDAVGGASATGHGESLMRIMMARSAAELMANGASASEAAQRSVEILARRTGGRGGLICLDAQGRIGAAYNTHPPRPRRPRRIRQYHPRPLTVIQAKATVGPAQVARSVSEGTPAHQLSTLPISPKRKRGYALSTLPSSPKRKRGYALSTLPSSPKRKRGYSRSPTVDSAKYPKA